MTIIAASALSIATGNLFAHTTKPVAQNAKIVEVPSRSDGYPEPCHIKIIDPYNSEIGTGGFRVTLPHIRSKYNDIFVDFICLTTRTDRWRAGLAAKFNNQTQAWERDIPNRMDSGAPELFAIFERAIHVFQLKSKNSTGFLITEDDSTGDESRRERMMTFCLLHGAQVLCGGGAVMRLEEPRSDKLSDVLTLLRNIEFVDE